MLRLPRLIPAILTAFAACTVNAATLQQLSMDEMGRSATSIVRARVVASEPIAYVSGHRSDIYTRYKLAVTETWKGAAATELMLPGGDLNGQKQSFPGVPELHVGGEYVLFLWKSPSTGITHALGLTQGIFDVTSQTDGESLVSRRQIGELMLDTTGHLVSDQAVNMRLADMKSRVRQAPVATGLSTVPSGLSK
jgi:hypothetical protein